MNFSFCVVTLQVQICVLVCINAENVSFCCSSGSFLSSRRGGLIRFQRPHALSLQMITADHENSGEQDPELSSETAFEATDASSELQEEENLKQIIVVSLQGFQERLKELRERGMLESAKLGYQDAQEKVQNLDAKQLITDLKSSQLSNHAARWWQTSDPWIKWPIAILYVHSAVCFLYDSKKVSRLYVQECQSHVSSDSAV